VSGNSANGGTDVSILHQQRRADGGEFDVRGRIDDVRGERVSFEETNERSSQFLEDLVDIQPKEEAWAK
jgi:hypothetical protein